MPPKWTTDSKSSLENWKRFQKVLGRYGPFFVKKCQERMKYQGLWAHYWCQRPFTSLLQHYLSTGSATLHLTRRVDHVATEVDSVTLRCDEMRCKAGPGWCVWRIGNKRSQVGMETSGSSEIRFDSFCKDCWWKNLQVCLVITGGNRFDMCFDISSHERMKIIS